MLNFSSKHLGADFKASIVAFLVALPLGLGIAMASGMPPAAGLVSSIIGGLLVGMIAGAPLQVSGAAAGLVVVVYNIVQQTGFQGLAAATLIAGLVQVVAGFAGLGRMAKRVAPEVVHGMLAGIGFIIMLSQFHVLFGQASGSSALMNLMNIPSTLAASGVLSANWTLMSTGILGILCMLGLTLWPKLSPRLASIVPAALVVTLAAIGASYLFFTAVPRVSLPASISDAVSWQGGNILAFLTNGTYWMHGIELAIIASIESMLCASAVTQLRASATVNYDRELSAQGLGNVVCGMVTALPITGVIVRSAASVHAGAQTRMATILHGAWVLVMLAFFASALATIPMTALAAILVLTGWKLLNLKYFAALARQGYQPFIVGATTMAMVVFIDLLFGVLGGIALSATWSFLAEGRRIPVFSRVRLAMVRRARTVKAR